MKIIVNGDARDVAAASLAAALDELGFRGAVVATALNGEFVASSARDRHEPRGRRSRRSSRADAGGAEMSTFYGVELSSRLMIGTARFPSPAILAQAIRASAAEVATVSLRREAGGERAGQAFWSIIRELGVRVLPNTAGCRSVKEAVTTAHMAREVFGTKWIKLEVIGEDDTLQPDVFALVEAARVLTADGFEVFPYTTEDLVVAGKLIDAGCQVLMPWGSPIGSGRGLNNVYGLKGAARAFLRRAARHRCRHRPAIARRPGHGAGLRCCVDQHRHRESARSCRDGGSVLRRSRSGNHGARLRPDGAA